MERLLYILARTVVWVFQCLPLSWIARIGRALGQLGYLVDIRHRRVALANLREAFGNERSEAWIRATVREHFRRLGENYGCAIKTATLPMARLAPRLKVTGVEHVRKAAAGGRSLVFAIGHFGNFELYARSNSALPEYKLATTYRALRQHSINRLVTRLRTHSGLLVFDRRREADALRQFMRREKVLLGLLCDQHAGRSGAWIPLFGRPCSTTKSPALYAQRFRLPLLAAVCFRTAPGFWTIEVSPPIPTREDGRRRSSEAIMTDVNRIFEEAIRRDPANWFWVHQRWKNPKHRLNS